MKQSTFMQSMWDEYKKLTQSLKSNPLTQWTTYTKLLTGDYFAYEDKDAASLYMYSESLFVIGPTQQFFVY